MKPGDLVRLRDMGMHGMSRKIGVVCEISRRVIVTGRVINGIQ